MRLAERVEILDELREFRRVGGFVQVQAGPFRGRALPVSGKDAGREDHNAQPGQCGICFNLTQKIPAGTASQMQVQQDQLREIPLELRGPTEHRQSLLRITGRMNRTDRAARSQPVPSQLDVTPTVVEQKNGKSFPASHSSPRSRSHSPQERSEAKVLTLGKRTLNSTASAVIRRLPFRDPSCLPCLPPPAPDMIPPSRNRKRPMNAIFSLYNLSTKVRDLSVHVFPLVIGRSPDAGITLDDRWVSRRHCLIEVQSGQLLVRDLGSKHGTFVNDGQVTESVLKPGDKLNIGLTTLVAAYEPPLANKAPAAISV